MTGVARGRTWWLTLAAGVAQLLALTALLAGHALIWLGGAAGVVGVGLGAWLVVPSARRTFGTHRQLWLLVPLLAGALAWLYAVLWWARHFGLQMPAGPMLPTVPRAVELPARLGQIAVLPICGGLLAAAGALVLVADAVRVRLGLAPRQHVPWRVLTESAGERPIDVASRVLAAVLLIAVAALLALGLASRFVAGDPTRQTLALLLIGGGGAMIIGVPALIGARLRLAREQVVDARERERQRLAALLHDSVLQTLALVQRQAHDPAAVARLARRQEHALRAWMAGEGELFSDTLVASLRDAVQTVEDEHAITIELTAIGDRAMDPRGEAVVAAAREALRNAARHGAGAPIFVFAEVSSSRVEVFVRDEGPGFDLAGVAAERRGIRDAIVGRMQAAGGEAIIDAAPGEGTEVALRVGALAGAR